MVTPSEGLQRLQAAAESGELGLLCQREQFGQYVQQIARWLLNNDTNIS